MTDQRNRVTTDPGLGPIEREHASTLRSITAADPIAGSATQDAFVSSRERSVWSGVGKFKLLREFHLSLHSRKKFYGKPLFVKTERVYAEI